MEMQRAPFLRGYQARTLGALVRGVARHRGATFTVLFPRQAGKNEVAAALVAYLLRTHARSGGTVVVCAPTFSPQAEISVARLRRTLAYTERLFPGPGRARITGATVSVGKAAATFLSAAPEAHVAGHTASIALIADEAQEIDAGWFDRQFRPMAASTGAPTVLFGTPWDGRSLLDRAVAANRARDAAQAGVRYRDWLPFHHEVGWREVAQSNPRYGDYVRAERERLGPGHPLFASQYELRTIEAASRLLSAGQLARLEGEHERLASPRAGERYVAGLDCGGEGERADASVLTIARLREGRCEVVQHARWRSARYGTMAGDVAALARQWRFERLCVDATGLGGPLAAQLAEALGPRVEPVVFTAASKSAMGYALIAAAETGSLAFYRDDGSAEAAGCRAELAACSADLRAGGGLRWGATRGHDDYAASMALCLQAARDAGSPRVARGRFREA
ncbi:MAG: hypothetical protein HYX53_16350 [Chloroflexi bacterium]|nr:hypothetical protein [Chloroflexota bacterium]